MLGRTAKHSLVTTHSSTERKSPKATLVPQSVLYYPPARNLVKNRSRVQAKLTETLGLCLKEVCRGVLTTPLSSVGGASQAQLWNA
jgi:hypothetical protein